MPQAAVGEPHAAVRREALRCLAQVLANVQALPPSDAKLVSECALNPKPCRIVLQPCGGLAAARRAFHICTRNEPPLSISQQLS